MAETTTELEAQSESRFSTKYKQTVFGAILIGQIVSILGSSITGFALRVWTFEETDSVTQFSLITFFYGLPGILLTPFAGVAADRWNRRYIMLFGDLLAVLATFTVWLLLITNRLELWHIYIGVSLISIGGTFQGPAYQASIPLLVAKENLGRANGFNQIGPALARILSPLMAGVLFATLGLRGILQIDMATFMFAFFILISVRIPKPPVTTDMAKKAAGSVYKEAALGWQYIKERKGLRNMMILSPFANFTQGMVVVLIAPLVLGFADVSVLGVVLAISGIGALIGAVAVIIRGVPKRRINGIYIFSILRSVLLLMGGIQANAWLIAFASALYLFFGQVAGASDQTLWQEKIPKDIQGRVFATKGLVAAIAFPLGQVIAGPLADKFFEPMLAVDGQWSATIGQWIGTGPGRGIALMFILLGTISLIITIISIIDPHIRHVEDEVPDAI